jgi:hypothetical protein
MIARLLTGLRLLRCAVWHDLRQRQNAVRCWTCHPPKKHLTPEERFVLTDIGKRAAEEIKRGIPA